MIIVHRWVYFAFLYFALALSVLLILVEWQNIRSIHDREHLNDEQVYLRSELRHARDELKEARASLKRLEDFVDLVKRAEEARQKRARESTK